MVLKKSKSWLPIAFILIISACEKVDIIDKNEKEWLKQHPNLIVGLSPNAPPYQFINEKGEEVGIFIDFLTIIEKRIDYKFKKVYQSDFSKLLIDTKVGSVDVLLEVQKTDERQQFLNFTPSLLSHKHVIVVRNTEQNISSIDDLKGKDIAVCNLYAVQEYLTKNYPTYSILPLFDDITCLRAVSTGQADAFISQQAVATYYIENQGISNLKIVGEIDYSNELAIASRKNLDTLNTVLSKAVNSISKTEKQNIYSNWLSYEAKPYYLETKFWIIIVVIFLCVTALIGLFNLALRKRVKQKTNELNSAKDKAEENESIIQKQYQELQTTEEEIRAANEELAATSDALKESNAELIKSNDKIEESENKLSNILNNINDLIWSISWPEMEILFLSPSVETLYGRTEQEFIKNPTLWQDLTHPDDKHLINKSIQELLEKGSSVRESRIIKPDGTIIWIIDKSKFIYDGNNNPIRVDGIVSNITDRKQAEEKLKEITNNWQTTFDAISDFVVLINTNHEIININKAGLESVDKPWNEVIGKKCFHLVHHTDCPIKDCPCDIALKEKRAIVNELEQNDKIYELTAWPVFDENNEITAFTHIIKDITERKQTENLLKQKYIELQSAKERAEESDNLKSSFLQNMSHEVRTPLNAIVGFSKLMIKPNLVPEKLEKFSNLISVNSTKLIEIITDVIEISQIQSNLVKAILTEIDIVLFIKSLVKSFTEKAKEKNIELSVNMKIPQNEYFILTDVEKLNKTFKHIIDNALKFTAKGSIEIICDLVETQDFASLNISITDTGIGISKEMQNKIFEPFRQVETGTTRDYGGNGLGLSIAKAYIELLNGSISIKSEINKGTTVTISIPVNKSSGNSKKNTTNVKKYKMDTILIAEDEYSNYQYLCELLAETELKIIYAENGQKALDLCKADSAIGLILMDIKMPIMDGYTTAILIKAFKPELPIIAQTAYALETEKYQFKGVFDDYLTKPIDEDDLRQKLMKYIDKK